MTEATPKSFVRRDRLRSNELRIQAKWAEEKVYETERKFDDNGLPKPKFMVTFPYPYMNGRLHLGHALRVNHKSGKKNAKALACTERSTRSSGQNLVNNHKTMF